MGVVKSIFSIRCAFSLVVPQPNTHTHTQNNYHCNKLKMFIF